MRANLKGKRSEEMTKEEYRDFLRYAYSFPSKQLAAIALGISRPTLDQVILTGYGKRETLTKIRTALMQAQPAA